MDVVNESISTRESLSSLPVQSSENDVQATQSTCTTYGRRTPSAVWGHFDKLVVNDELKAKCRHCDKLLSRGSKSWTSHLRDHLTIRCSKKNKKVDIRQKMLGINRRMDGSSTLENTNFNQESSRKELANMVIVHEYPLAIVDHIGFRRFVHSLNPNFKFMSRNTLKADIMKSFASEKATLKKVLENSKSRISITTDMWTATNQRRGYMVVTAHYIDQLWQLRNKILRFAYVPCPHTKVTLAQVLLDTLNGYNIAEKISSIVVDNCSTNDAMMEIMKLRLGEYLMLEGRFLHMRCTAHILNLIVQDGLDVIWGGIEKVHDCVAFWVATPKRIELFEDKVKSMKGEEARKLPLDCKTRWNSTFLMLEGVLPYKDVFGNLKRQYHRLKFTSPSQEEWELAALVCDKLKSFHKLTGLFSVTLKSLESAFSMGGRVISPHRSKLATSTVEALVCMQNWILGEYFSGTSLDIIESCATILEDRDRMDHDSVGNNVDSQIIDLDSGDDDGMDFM